eukprot:14366439-Alexandrium_andersonii.AAC.1
MATAPEHMGRFLPTEAACRELGRMVPAVAASRVRSPLGACIAWGLFGRPPHKAASVGGETPHRFKHCGRAKRAKNGSAEKGGEGHLFGQSATFPHRSIAPPSTDLNSVQFQSQGLTSSRGVATGERRMPR